MGVTYVRGPNGWHKHLNGTGEPNWHRDEVFVINTTSDIVCVSWFAGGQIPQKLRVLVLYGDPLPFYTADDMLQWEREALDSGRYSGFTLAEGDTGCFTIPPEYVGREVKFVVALIVPDSADLEEAPYAAVPKVNLWCHGS